MPSAAQSITSETSTKYAREEDIPEHTLFVITTDGCENASRTYSSARVKEMIEHQKEKDGWEFLFLGANIDAIATAGRMGIRPERAVQYHCDSRGQEVNYQVLSETVATYRSCGAVPDDWKAEVEKDYSTRKKS